jgi:hypothetical protein
MLLRQPRGYIVADSLLVLLVSGGGVRNPVLAFATQRLLACSHTVP